MTKLVKGGNELTRVSSTAERGSQSGPVKREDTRLGFASNVFQVTGNSTAVTSGGGRKTNDPECTGGLWRIC